MKLQRLPYDEKVKLLESLGRIYRREKTRELIVIVMKFTKEQPPMFKRDRTYD